MGSSIREIMRQLKENSPEVFADTKKEALPKIDMSKVSATTPPSELKRMGDAIRIKRLSAPGLETKELKELMRRIGK